MRAECLFSRVLISVVKEASVSRRRCLASRRARTVASAAAQVTQSTGGSTPAGRESGIAAHAKPAEAGLEAPGVATASLLRSSALALSSSLVDCASEVPRTTTGRAASRRIPGNRSDAPREGLLACRLSSLLPPSSARRRATGPADSWRRMETAPSFQDGKRVCEWRRVPLARFTLHTRLSSSSLPFSNSGV